MNEIFILQLHMNFEQEILKKRYDIDWDIEYNDMEESSTLKCHLFFTIIAIPPFEQKSLISFPFSIYWI